MLKENLIMAWGNIKNSKMRSFLTSLGIVIGVAAVIALITIIQSATGEMMSQFESRHSDGQPIEIGSAEPRLGRSRGDRQCGGRCPVRIDYRFRRQAGNLAR